MNSGLNGKKVLLNIVAAGAIFGLGIGIGSDAISLESVGWDRQSAKISNGGKLDYGGVEELHESLKAGFDGQLDRAKLEDGLKEGLVKAAGDPFTEYLNEEASKEFKEQLSGSFEGIGAELNKDKASIVVISPIEGFPAEKAGIKARDVISKINDESAHDISVTEAVKKIRGPKGTKVKLDIIRGGKILKFDITRQQIDIPSVKTEITPDNIGIIKVSRFGEDTTVLAREAATNLKSKNVKGVILDMRGNPGGLLEVAVELSSIWLTTDKRVLEEKRDHKVIKTHYATGSSILNGVPTVVLIDGGSASASEIVAGALRDNNAAYIIGTKSFGKGSVQELRQLRDGGSLKVTIARWFTPKGRNIDKEGIEPDQKVEFSEKEVADKVDPQKDAAIDRLKR